MKVICLLIATVSMISWVAHPQTQSSQGSRSGSSVSNSEKPNEHQFQDLEEKSWIAWKGRDATFFKKFLSDDHVELSAHGTANKALVVASVGSPKCKVRSYSLDHFKFLQVSADTALLTYHATQDTTCGTSLVPSPVWASSLYVKRNGQWLNVLYQQSAGK